MDLFLVVGIKWNRMLNESKTEQNIEYYPLNNNNLFKKIKQLFLMICQGESPGNDSLI